MGEASDALAAGDRRFRLASPAMAVILGALSLALTILYAPLAWPARDIGLPAQSKAGS